MRQELGVLDMFHVLIVVTLEVRVGIPRSPTVLHREAKPSRETVQLPKDRSGVYGNMLQYH